MSLSRKSSISRIFHSFSTPDLLNPPKVTRKLTKKRPNQISGRPKSTALEHLHFPSFWSDDEDSKESVVRRWSTSLSRALNSRKKSRHDDVDEIPPVPRIPDQLPEPIKITRPPPAKKANHRRTKSLGVFPVNVDKHQEVISRDAERRRKVISYHPVPHGGPIVERLPAPPVPTYIPHESVPEGYEFLSTPINPDHLRSAIFETAAKEQFPVLPDNYSFGKTPEKTPRKKSVDQGPVSSLPIRFRPSIAPEKREKKVRVFILDDNEPVSEFNGKVVFKEGKNMVIEESDNAGSSEYSEEEGPPAPRETIYLRQTGKPDASPPTWEISACYPEWRKDALGISMPWCGYHSPPQEEPELVPAPLLTGLPSAEASPTAEAAVQPFMFNMSPSTGSAPSSSRSRSRNHSASSTSAKLFLQEGADSSDDGHAGSESSPPTALASDDAAKRRPSALSTHIRRRASSAASNASTQARGWSKRLWEGLVGDWMGNKLGREKVVVGVVARRGKGERRWVIDESERGSTVNL